MRVSGPFRMVSAVLVAAFLVVSLSGATAQESSSPRDKLALWVGHWKVRITTHETQFDHARTEDYDAKCSLLPNGVFMVCDYLSLQPHPESGPMTDVSLFYYSDVDKSYKYTNLATEGGPREFKFVVDGNVWTRPFQAHGQNGEVLEAREIYTFVSADKQLARQEVSTDKGAHWTVVHDAVGIRAQ